MALVLVVMASAGLYFAVQCLACAIRFWRTSRRRDCRRAIVEGAQDAERIRSLRRDLQTLVDHLTRTRHDDAEVQRLGQRFNPSAVSVPDGFDGCHSPAYVVNKGDRLVMSVRDYGGRLVQRNLLMYVSMGLIARMMTPELGGTPPRYVERYAMLVDAATDLGLYTYVDYGETPSDYCGIVIDRTFGSRPASGP